MTYGWGMGEWGTSPWGTGTAPTEAPSFGKVFAIGDRTIRAQLTFEPAHSDPTVVGDALNPRTWRVTVTDTGRRISVLGVQEISAQEYEMQTLELLENVFVSLTLASNTLTLPNGSPVLGFSIGFQGQVATYNSSPQAQTTAAGLALRDIANPPAPNSPVGGTLEVTSNGDYKSVTGASLVRKLIIRRLISKPGDFFHLPNYGAGLVEKEPLQRTDLRRLAKDLEQQVKQEPEVDAVRASVAFVAASNTLVVQMQVRLRQTGEQIAVGVTVPSGAISL